MFHMFICIYRCIYLIINVYIYIFTYIHSIHIYIYTVYVCIIYIYTYTVYVLYIYTHRYTYGCVYMKLYLYILLTLYIMFAYYMILYDIISYYIILYPIISFYTHSITCLLIPWHHGQCTASLPRQEQKQELMAEVFQQERLDRWTSLWELSPPHVMGSQPKVALPTIEDSDLPNNSWLLVVFLGSAPQWNIPIN